MKVLLYILIILIVLIIVIVLESIREHKIFKVKTYIISNDKVPDSFRKKRIVVFSDLHNTFYGDKNEKILSKIKALKPDIIILAGDMPVANSENRENNLKTAGFIAKLLDIADIYYGVGNHEKRMAKLEHLKADWEKYIGIISNYNGKHKLYYLDNKKISLNYDESRINIYGLDLELSYYQRFSKKTLSPEEISGNLGIPNPDEFNILIAHNPEYFKSYIEWGADLILSGHVHGGMVRLPIIGGVISPKPELFPHFDYGQYKKDNSIMILSNGLGSHSIKLRINNIPEILLIEFD
ncbi:MAG: metallophosphoesterase [Lachnospiraceae bacterium]|nr:metallophosphoesterase [Lachnospiraceae bacterium]